MASIRSSVIFASCIKICLLTTLGLPRVIVPVLSKTMVCILRNSSSGSPPLIKIPLDAPIPLRKFDHMSIS